MMISDAKWPLINPTCLNLQILSHAIIYYNIHLHAYPTALQLASTRIRSSEIQYIIVTTTL